MINVIIAGSRDFTNAGLLSDRAAKWVQGLPIGTHNSEITVICGDARGADKLGADWAGFNGIVVEHMPAKWQRPDGTLDRAAGHKRNAEMADVGDVLLAFWDGESKGTKGMIDVAMKKGLEVHVYRV